MRSTASALVVLVAFAGCGGKSRAEREADYRRCVYKSIVGVNTSAGKLDRETRDKIEALRDKPDCKKP